MKYYFVFLFLSLLFFLSYFMKPGLMNADAPASSNYRLVNYGFGSGGVLSASSATYSLLGTVGEIDASRSSSTNFTSGDGLIYTMIASVAAAPTFTNPSSYYNKLLVKVNPITNPSDYTYAIAISNDNFATDTEYVQSDN